MEKKPEKPELTRKQQKRYSMMLSKILRHTAHNHNLKIDSEGYILVSSLLKVQKLKSLSIPALKKIVETNSKKRFQLKTEKSLLYIRAVQGHSIKNLNHNKMLELLKKENPILKKTIVHGTFLKFWPMIEKGGLKTMSRNHVHMAVGYPGDEGVISGMRAVCDVFVEIDVELAMRNGIEFFVSRNGVVLSSGVRNCISPAFFKRVFKVENGKKSVIFENKVTQDFCFKYLLVLDFEANSEKHKRIQPVQEIIEFPIVALDTKTNEIMEDKIFHHYVKPTETEMTPFITELTGITKDMVAKGKPLEEVINLSLKFIKENFKEDEICFITCGDFDFRCLAREAKFKKIDLPLVLRKYINIKEVFKCCFNFKEDKCSMTDMLGFLNLKLDGKHHSGIDDSKNIAKILQEILKTGFLLTKNFSKVIENKK